MLHGRRDDLSFLAGPRVDPRAGVPRPVYLVLDRGGAVRGTRVGTLAPGASVRDLTALVERYLQQESSPLQSPPGNPEAAPRQSRSRFARNASMDESDAPSPGAVPASPGL